MLHADQDRWPRPQGAYGFSGSAGTYRESIHALAREIEETQRRQGETIAHIVDRLRALDLQRAAANAASQSTLEQLVEEEPWDAASAEALMRSHEADAAAAAARVASYLSGSDSTQHGPGYRFQDVTERIKRALSDLKPGSNMRLLEERLEHFQRHISSLLNDVVRRSDVEGLKLIETHINYLSDKLDELDRHVSRLDGIEADVRSVMDQVSDERIGSLLQNDNRLAADLEALATRAAEEMRTRLAEHETRTQAHDQQRHEELRKLIETSINEQRKAEAEASTAMTGLSGRMTAQADRYDEIKTLLESAIQEQRANEQTAFGMLDTLQQAMVRVLDRMDVIEQQQQPMPDTWQAAASVDAVELPSFAARDPDTNDSVPADAAGDATPVQEAAGRIHDFGFSTDLVSSAPLEVPSAFSADLGAEAPAAEEENESPVDRLRRDFIADARRAKMKAAANRAEANVEKSEMPKRSIVDTLRGQADQTARQPGAGGGRLFGASPKLLAGVLALVVAINGGILLVNRKNTPPVAPEITVGPAGSKGDASEGATETPPSSGQRSELGLDAEPNRFAAGAEDRASAPFGFSDDVFNSSTTESLGQNVDASAPGGVTIARPTTSMPDDVVADIYQQQIFASLSGKLGTLAAGHSPGALLPEKGGRIDAAFTPPDTPIEPNDRAARSSALDLPPASVGPLSLRLAAANGDASAEFEVAARLAEGKGTKQDLADALRWYQRSAARGFAQAQYRLGTLYERGLGVSQDLGRARIWYSRAAEQGNVKSMHNLAVLAAGGDNGQPDYASALQWFTKAADHGLSDSQYNLGVLLENGLGVKPDRISAYKWYALAAKSGDADALSRREAMKGLLSAQDLKNGDGQIAAFKARSSIPLANDARAAGEDWKKRVNNDTNG
jgi:localization factor PodJL